MNRNSMVSLESLEIGVHENSRMVNCSDNGLYFESDLFLQPGAEVFIQVENYPNDQTEPFICHHAKIIWGKKLKNAPYPYGYGAKYVVLSNEQDSLETDSDEIDDLRRHPRKYVDKPVTLGFENKSFNGFISDISRNGCFIKNREFLNIGQILKLAIPGTKFVGNNRLSVEVVRLSPIGVGVKFKSRKKPGSTVKVS
ncbi:MAG: PilZ domain-containing protein [Desulfobacteraceae bacterium]|nr:PilZ domain-containing protein [Desulfobacteraceae bacterium]